ncbi:unnamed protein product [Protopolystoma xenopodis]|uniref:Uncharacterized protein n=1 Tax=Protopolystoma xenopodis TaxID=117903 RepID=A0A448WLZ4_9PLAT|nr:unnamed protein product [Protopolystoma xenopodis]
MESIEPTIGGGDALGSYGHTESSFITRPSNANLYASVRVCVRYGRLVNRVPETQLVLPDTSRLGLGGSAFMKAGACPQPQQLWVVEATVQIVCQGRRLGEESCCRWCVFIGRFFACDTFDATGNGDKGYKKVTTAVTPYGDGCHGKCHMETSVLAACPAYVTCSVGPEERSTSAGQLRRRPSERGVCSASTVCTSDCWATLRHKLLGRKRHFFMHNCGEISPAPGLVESFALLAIVFYHHPLQPDGCRAAPVLSGLSIELMPNW